MSDPIGRNFSMQKLLQERADHNPNAIAIAAPERTPLTYARLWGEIFQTAKRLRELGVDQKARVAIVLPNGPEMAVSFLSVSSIAASAPINPSYRAAEFDFYLSDLNVTAVLIQSGVDSPVIDVAKKRGIPILELEPAIGEPAGVFTVSGAQVSSNELDDFRNSDDLALLLHTSGTTSKPKIVPLTHRNIGYSAYNIAASLDLSQNDCCLNVMPLFHIHGLIASVLSSLTAGGTVVCTPGFLAPNFFEWMETFHPTWYTAVPTMHQSILQRAGTNQKIIERNPLRFIRSSSSALPSKVMAELESVFRAPVIEAYGMTEASHQMSTNPLPPGVRKPGSVGIATVEIAVMDPDGNLLGSENAGEIVIRGPNVMGGYENNAAANESSFRNGWFRTGDQGHLDSDGYLSLTGRLKEIINRAGEKISPREIDEVLMEHPAVAQVVAFAVPHPDLGEEVGAAIVLNGNGSVTDKEIREFAGARLADFKIPRRIVFLQEIPKGPTGKLQRIGLAERLGIAMVSESPEVKSSFTAPATELEKTVAKIWAEVLGIPEVGAKDDFFSLGGDSILATQILSRIRVGMEVELSFVVFLETPTVQGMAKSIKECTRSTHRISSIERISREGELPLSRAQQRLWFLDQLLPGNPAFNRPVIVRLSGQFRRDVLELTLKEILRRHEILRTSFDSFDGQPVLRISSAKELSLKFVGLQDALIPEQELQAFLKGEVVRPFDLKQAPLIRAHLLRLAKNDHVLVLNFHHIIFDGWSVGVLFKEIGSLYDAFSNGKPSPLPELPIQYVDFASWQHKQLEEGDLDSQLSYWTNQLNNLSRLNLPTDKPRPRVQTYVGAYHNYLISAEISESIKTSCRKESITPFMPLLAAFQILLHEYSKQDDVVVGTVLANRNRLETENLIGFFVNLVVLRMDFSGNPNFREVLQRVRNLSLDAYSNQDLPFEKVVEALNPKRSLTQTPLFQVLFVLQNSPMPPVELPQTKLSVLEIDPGVSQFDLVLNVQDTPQGFLTTWRYNTDLFQTATVTGMSDHYVKLLRDILTVPSNLLK